MQDFLNKVAVKKNITSVGLKINFHDVLTLC